jgi:S1-C subfamily serine protease
MLVDVLVVAACIAAFFRGKTIGFTRQVCSTAGFFGGMLIGFWAAQRVVGLAHSADTRAVLTVSIILGSAIFLLTVGEYLGLRLKSRMLPKALNTADNGLGGVISAASVLIGIWLLASILSGSSPSGPIQSAIRGSNIISRMDRMLPPAPGVISRLSHLIDPNGFPDVFIGNEPVPHTSVNLPALGDLAGAVNADRDSVVRIKGQGCGGVVSGSGFVVGHDLIATNAHVVAGTRQPYVQDADGSHPASAIWFDPDLDFALLKTNGVHERSLDLNSSIAARDTPSAVLGYPGGGNFSAKPAVVLDEIKAAGRNIYGTGHTLRDVYEVQADVVPGNSGGPLVGKDGKVIGMIFAESTNYNHVGYALTTEGLSQTIRQASAENHVRGTGRCAE